MDKDLVNASVRYSDRLNVLYLNNPKVACTTIVYSLWAAVDRLNGQKTLANDIHDRTRDPFAKDIFAIDAFNASNIRKATVFSVVRNPFVRILSAYLDKIGGDPNVWNRFRKRFGLKPGLTRNELSFRDFLHLVIDEPDELVDQHFHSQRLNLLLPLSKPSFIGRIEEMDEVARFLDAIGAPMKPYKAHATNSQNRILYHYDRDCIAMVREKYADDFRLFGYSTNLNELKDFKKVDLPGGHKDFIIDWIVTGKPPVELFDPGEKTFYAFQAAEAREKKIDMIHGILPLDCNWERLSAYSHFAQREKQSALHNEIEERIALLKRQHVSRVENKDIFV